MANEKKKSGAASPSAPAVKAARKRAKKMPLWAKILLVAVFICSALAGAGTAYLLTRTDTFELNAGANLLYTEGDTVEKQSLVSGVVARSLGRDISGTLTVSTTLTDADGNAVDLSGEGTVRLTEGVYYTTYTVKTQLGRTVRRIQTILVSAAGTPEGGESHG